MRDIVDIPLDAALIQIGKGDPGKGREFILELAKRLEHARASHPHWAERTKENPLYPVQAIRGEVDELEHAIRYESPERQNYEAMDVVVTGAKVWLGDCKG